LYIQAFVLKQLQTVGVYVFFGYQNDLLQRYGGMAAKKKTVVGNLNFIHHSAAKAYLKIAFYQKLKYR